LTDRCREERAILESATVVGLTSSDGRGAPGPGTNEVTVCFFGDGTTNIGAFHEALNLAAVWTLPVVFVCENNRWMEYTPIRAVTALEHPAADRALSYGLTPSVVDGNDADAVYAVATDAIERAGRGGGPSLVEAETYRHGGHSRADRVALHLRDPYRPRACGRGGKSTEPTRSKTLPCPTS